MTPALLHLLPEKLARQHRIFPLDADDTSITLASAQHLDPKVLENLRFTLDRTIHHRLFSEKKIESLIAEHYPLALFQTAEGSSVSISPSSTAEPDFRKTTDHENPVIRHVKMLLDEAIQAEASDLHLESFETECRIRYRIDGVLLEKKRIPWILAEPMISRLKLLAHLDITERRLPQDGRLQHTLEKAWSCVCSIVVKSCTLFLR